MLGGDYGDRTVGDGIVGIVAGGLVDIICGREIENRQV